MAGDRLLDDDTYIMHDIPEEYLVSSVTFTYEAFQEFLAQKQLFLYQPNNYQVQLDDWRLAPAAYRNTLYWWEKDEWITNGLLAGMQGKTVFVAVYETYPQLHFTLLQLNYEVFSVLADSLSKMLAPDNYEIDFFLFNEDFSKAASYDKSEFYLYTNFALYEGEEPVELNDNIPQWRRLLNDTNIASLQQIARKHEDKRISDMSVWFPLKEALEQNHRAENYPMLEKLYACLEALDEVTTDWPLWDIYDDIACWYYYRETQGNWAEDVFRYLYHHQVRFGGIAGGTEQPFDQASFVNTHLKSKDASQWKGALRVLFCHYDSIKRQIPQVLVFASNHVDKIKISLKYGYEELYIRHIEKMELHQDSIIVTLGGDQTQERFDLEALAHQMGHQTRPQQTSLLRTDPIQWFRNNNGKLKSLRKLHITGERWQAISNCLHHCGGVEELQIDKPVKVS